jgi:hypothetical protein
MPILARTASPKRLLKAVLNLGPFEQFAYLTSALERYPTRIIRFFWTVHGGT